MGCRARSLATAEGIQLLMKRLHAHVDKPLAHKLWIHFSSSSIYSLRILVILSSSLFTVIAVAKLPVVGILLFWSDGQNSAEFF